MIDPAEKWGRVTCEAVRAHGACLVLSMLAAELTRPLPTPTPTYTQLPALPCFIVINNLNQTTRKKCRCFMQIGKQCFSFLLSVGNLIGGLTNDAG